MNTIPETMKLLEENIGGELLAISLGDKYLDLTPKAKARINGSGDIKLQNLLHSKGNH